MRLKIFIALLCLIVNFIANAQKEIGGITLPTNLKFKETNLVLNGAGIRKKYWMDMYVGGLYLEKKSNDANSVIEDDKNMAIRIHIVSSLITTKKMMDAVDEGLKKSTNGKQSEFKEEIDKFKAVFQPEIKEGDIYDIVYIPSVGTVILKNSKLSVTIKGIKFKKALFGIWFCSDPADEDLKKAMLGN